MSFSDLFKASIDNCTTLNDCQKLQYVKALVKGDAAKLISSVPLTSANYSIAWKILVDRYQNERAPTFMQCVPLLAFNVTYIEIDSVSAWSDSTNVLSWLSGRHRKWKTFLANRVADIQETLPPNIWRHISATHLIARAVEFNLQKSLTTHFG